MESAMMTKSRFSFPLLIVYGLLTLGAVAMMVPFFWMLLTSVKIDAEIFAVPMRWLPSQFDFANYADAFTAVEMGRLFKNTVIVTAISVLSQIVLCAMAGYAFARLEFVGKQIIFFSLLITMMVPFEVLVIPLFILARSMPLAGGNDLFGQGGTGLLNSYGGLIFPELVSVYGIFIFRQFFQGFPKELEDAAQIDGCSRFRFFWSILVPNSAPVIGTMGLFAFLWSWNDFFWPLVIVNTDRLQTLQLGLAAFNREAQTDWAELMAASVMATLPVILLFLTLQRFLVRGVATTGLKG